MSAEKESDLAIDFLRATADGQAANDRSTPSVRAQAVRKALDCINPLSATGLTVSELCSATNVPWRTLSRAFNERFGIGPKKYLKSVRLAYELWTHHELTARLRSYSKKESRFFIYNSTV